MDLMACANDVRLLCALVTGRARFGKGEFVEVYVSTSLEACEERDPKGLYKKVWCMQRSPLHDIRVHIFCFSCQDFVY